MKKYFILFAFLFIFLLFIGAPVRSIYAPVKYRSLIKEYAGKYDLDWLLVDSVIYHESRFRKQAVSPRGACGLMQLMPATADEVARKLGWKNYSEQQLFNPRVNIELGCYYLNSLLKEFHGDVKLALVAYNAGKGNVYRWHRNNKKTSKKSRVMFSRIARSLFPETKRYVVKVYGTYQLLKVLNKIWRM